MRGEWVREITILVHRHIKYYIWNSSLPNIPACPGLCENRDSWKRLFRLNVNYELGSENPESSKRPYFLFNPSGLNAPFLYPLKTSENRMALFSGGRERVLWEQTGWDKETISYKWLSRDTSFYQLTKESFDLNSLHMKSLINHWLPRYNFFACFSHRRYCKTSKNNRYILGTRIPFDSMFCLLALQSETQM